MAFVFRVVTIFGLPCSKKRRRKLRVESDEWRVKAVKEKPRSQISFLSLLY